MYFCFMDLNFEYNGVSASNRLETFAAEKLNHLSERYDFMISTDVYFKSENSSDPEKGKITGIRVNVPNTRLYAEANEAEFTKSTAEALSALEHQLEKFKRKLKK